MDLPFWSGVPLALRFTPVGRANVLAWLAGLVDTGWLVMRRPTAVLTERCFVCGCCCPGSGVGGDMARLVGPVLCVRLCAVAEAEGSREDTMYVLAWSFFAPSSGVFVCT